jgi:hypothetical protein
MEVHAPEDLAGAVTLVDAFDFDHGAPFLVLEVLVASLDHRGEP